MFTRRIEWELEGAGYDQEETYFLVPVRSFDPVKGAGPTPRPATMLAIAGGRSRNSGLPTKSSIPKRSQTFSNACSILKTDPSAVATSPTAGYASGEEELLR